MNKITSKYCCIFAMNELRKLNNTKRRYNRIMPKYINEHKRLLKDFYNLEIKHKLGKRK